MVRSASFIYMLVIIVSGFYTSMSYFLELAVNELRTRSKGSKATFGFLFIRRQETIHVTTV